MTSVFKRFEDEAYPYKYAGELTVGRILGGTPDDPKVVEGWLRKKLAGSNDTFLLELITRTMEERSIDENAARKVVEDQRTVNGFKRDEQRGLYVEGRQLKAALKEATMVAVAADKISPRGWGKTNKGILSFLAEHVFVPEEKLYLGVTEPTGVLQGFVHTWRGDSIKYEEYVDGARIQFTVITDWPFSEQDWATIWLCGQRQGLGASRSQGYGTYEVTRWDSVGAPVKAKPVKAAKPKADPETAEQ